LAAVIVPVLDGRVRILQARHHDVRAARLEADRALGLEQVPAGEASREGVFHEAATRRHIDRAVDRVRLVGLAVAEAQVRARVRERRAIATVALRRLEGLATVVTEVELTVEPRQRLPTGRDLAEEAR